MPGANMANRDAEPSKRKVRLIPSIAAMIGLAVTIGTVRTRERQDCQFLISNQKLIQDRHRHRPPSLAAYQTVWPILDSTSRWRPSMTHESTGRPGSPVTAYFRNQLLFR